MYIRIYKEWPKKFLAFLFIYKTQLRHQIEIKQSIMLVESSIKASGKMRGNHSHTVQYDKFVLSRLDVFYFTSLPSWLFIYRIHLSLSHQSCETLSVSLSQRDQLCRLTFTMDQSTFLIALRKTLLIPGFKVRNG